MRRRLSLLIVVPVVALAACHGESPLDPYDRHGPPVLIVRCDPNGQSPLQCEARISCALYPCAPGTPSVVTDQATWSTGDAAVVRLAGPGQFEAVAPGHTVVTARWQETEGQRPVAVFPGYPPMPTHELFGTVYVAGQTPASGPLPGAVITVLGGLADGRTATAGSPPDLLPGYAGPVGGPGYYRVIGVPPGVYRLRASLAGYLDEEREVTVREGSAGTDFPMRLR